MPKILVVEDDPWERNSLIAALQKALPQHELVTANNAQDARALIDTAAPGEIFAAVFDQHFPDKPFTPEQCDRYGQPDGEKVAMSDQNGSFLSEYLWQNHGGEIPIVLHSSTYRDVKKPEYWKYDSKNQADPRKWILMGKTIDSAQIVARVLQHLAQTASHLPLGHQPRSTENITQQGPGRGEGGEVVR